MSIISNDDGSIQVKTDLPEICEAFYLDYFNNYLTIDAIADAYHITPILASHMIEFGRWYHRNVKN